MVRASRVNRSANDASSCRWGVEHLDGDGAVEGPVPRPVDGAHAAGADQLEAVEVGEPAAQLLGARRGARSGGGAGGGLRAESGA